jgi:hypothetical protein
LSSVAAPPAVRLWKTFRSKPNAIPGDDKRLFAFPPESVFSFRPECCSASQRNGVQLQSGIAFTFDRIPQFDTRAPVMGSSYLELAVSGAVTKT